MRKFIITVSLLLPLTLCQVYAKRVKKTNVLLIYTDDHRYSGVHALGCDQVKTPNIDELANNGIIFTHTYLMGAFTGATSIASRAQLLTGRNLFELDGAGFTIPEKDVTMPQVFKNAGYYTYHIGKWDQDFKSIVRSFCSSGKITGKPAYLEDKFRMPFIDWKPNGDYKREDCYLLQYDENGAIQKRVITKDDKRGPIGTENNGPHVSKVLADDAINFINGYTKKEPFFMYLAFQSPHDPRQSPQSYKDLYPEDKIKLTPSYMPQHPFDNGNYVLRDEELAPWPRTPEVTRKELSDYYSIITYLDEQIGRVIKSLKDKGEYDNTIIIFAGDSGLGVGNHGLLGKQNIYDEDGIHVPFIISGGKLEKEDRGRQIDALCYIHNIMPTICDMVGVKIPSSVTAKSLFPIINNEKNEIMDSGYYAYLQYQRAYRKGDYKLIEYVKAPGYNKKDGTYWAGSRVTQLFNIKKDPWEIYNIAYFPQYKDLLFTMQKEMKLKAIEVGDNDDSKRCKSYFWNYYN